MVVEELKHHMVVITLVVVAVEQLPQDQTDVRLDQEEMVVQGQQAQLTEHRQEELAVVEVVRIHNQEEQHQMVVQQEQQELQGLFTDHLQQLILVAEAEVVQYHQILVKVQLVAMAALV
tara:strand:+ start:545 stop:901 length:357 start_codon:yes stop_codon:yes gene_type:complete